MTKLSISITCKDDSDEFNIIDLVFIKKNVYEEKLEVWNSNSSPYRTRHQRYSIKKGVLKNVTKFTGKHMCQSLFINKKMKFLRTPYLQNTSGQLLLVIGNKNKHMKTLKSHIWENKLTYRL